MLRRVFTFLLAICSYWGSLVTGGFLIGIISIYAGTGHPVNPWVYWVIAALGVVIAFYRAWQDQYLKVEKLQTAQAPQLSLDERVRGLATSLWEYYVQRTNEVPDDPKEPVVVDEETQTLLTDRSTKLLLYEEQTVEIFDYKFKRDIRMVTEEANRAGFSTEVVGLFVQPSSVEEATIPIRFIPFTYNIKCIAQALTKTADRIEGYTTRTQAF